MGLGWVAKHCQGNILAPVLIVSHLDIPVLIAYVHDS